MSVLLLVSSLTSSQNIPHSPSFTILHLSPISPCRRVPRGTGHSYRCRHVMTRGRRSRSCHRLGCRCLTQDGLIQTWPLERERGRCYKCNIVHTYSLTLWTQQNVLFYYYFVSAEYLWVMNNKITPDRALEQRKGMKQSEKECMWLCTEEFNQSLWEDSLE